MAKHHQPWNGFDPFWIIPNIVHLPILVGMLGVQIWAGFLAPGMISMCLPVLQYSGFKTAD